MKTTMPAGTYYIGDLCYVLHDVWPEVCDQPRNRKSVLQDGREIWYDFTEYGDGTYLDEHGRQYDVDSGTLGLIRTRDIILEGENSMTNGHVIHFKKDFEVWRDDSGTFYFGDHMQIVTGDMDDEEAA